jgi:DNA repair exonuclease SbcCD ATPase subunit
MKRSFPTDDVTAKRRHANVAERLVDLPDAFAAFSDPLAAERALQKGLLKNWNATEKYHELESKLLTYHRDAEDETWLKEAALMDAIPELKSLEAETLATLLNQHARHLAYERAAATRVSHATERADEQRKMLLQASTDKSMRLQAKIEELQGELEQANDDAREAAEAARAAAEEAEKDFQRQLDEQAEEAKEQIDELEARCREQQEELNAATEETELKRASAAKLKEEVIGNDRLTVANLNRIKMLEAQLDEERQANEELARENDELRGRPSAEKVDALQEMLGEREQQLIQLSRKLEESESRENVSKLGNIGDRLSGSFKARTDNSLLDRLGINRF